MSGIIKTAITQISDGDDVIPSIANQPHADLETNIDDIISYVTGGVGGYFEYDSITSSGLTFEYTSGIVNMNSTVTTVAAAGETLTASQTNYVFFDTSAGTIEHNITGFLYTDIPLWKVTTDASNITAVVDQRTLYSSVTKHQDNTYLYFGDNDDFALLHNGTHSYLQNGTGVLYIDEYVTSGSIYLRTYDSGDTIKNGIRMGGATPNVGLYYGGLEKLTTTNNGISVSSTVATVLSEGTAGYGSFYAKSSGTNDSYIFFGNGGGEKSRITSFDSGALYFSTDAGASTQLKLHPTGVSEFSGDVSVGGRIYGGGAPNFHLDCISSGILYLNYFSGTGGTIFGNGAGAGVASVSSIGAISAASFTSTGALSIGSIASSGGISATTVSGSSAPTAASHLTRKDYVDSLLIFTKTYTSGEQTISGGGTLSLTHSLGGYPEIVRVYVICKIAEYGYSIGDRLEVSIALNQSIGAAETAMSFRTTSTQILIKYGLTTTPITAIRLDTGNGIYLTNANWRLVVKAFV